MLYALPVAGFLLGAFLAIRSRGLLMAAIWLAAASALVALLLYLLGAAQVAVIELSVGAGLVTVLLVFAIAIAGEELVQIQSLVPLPLAVALVAISVLLLLWLNLPLLGISIPLAPAAQPSFAATLWQLRGADVLVQVVLLFSGVIGVLGLLGQVPVPSRVLAPTPVTKGQPAAAAKQEGRA